MATVEAGELYIASGHPSGALKIGRSASAFWRTTTLNLKLEHSVTVDAELCTIEAFVHRLLDKYRVARRGTAGDSNRGQTELFSCSIQQAIKAIELAKQATQFHRAYAQKLADLQAELLQE